MSGVIQFLLGGRLATGQPTPVSTNDPLPVTLSGSTPAPPLQRVSYGDQKTTLNNSTVETTIVTAGAAGVFNDVYSIIFANTGVTPTQVDIRRATAGSVTDTFYVPAGDTRGFTLPWDSAKKQPVAANNWTAKCSAGTVSMEISVDFVKAIS